MKMERELVIRPQPKEQFEFLSIPEEADESFSNTESILRNYMKKELRVQDVEDIPIERANSVGQTAFKWQASTNHR